MKGIQNTEGHIEILDWVARVAFIKTVTFEQRHAEPKEVNSVHRREDCVTETEQSVERPEAGHAWDVQEQQASQRS